MRLSSALFSLSIFVLVSYAVHATVIDFEDLTPADPGGHPTDSWGKLADGYCGFDWARGPSDDPASGAPRWASLESFISMPGTDTAYAYGHGIAMQRPGNGFTLSTVDLGSYFHTGQDIALAGWNGDVLKYQTVATVGPSFHLTRLAPGFEDIDRFALWAGERGSLDVPFSANHVLCIDNIIIEDMSPAPVPEPSTLLILGSGILCFTTMYRKYTLPRGTGRM